MLASTIYEQDFYDWEQKTVSFIQTGMLNVVDWDQLAEELQDLGKEQKNQLENHLLVLYDHLLKITNWSQQRNYNQRRWRAIILEQWKQLKTLLKRSTILKPYHQEITQEMYDDSRQITSLKTGLALGLFPQSPIANMEKIVNEWWSGLG